MPIHHRSSISILPGRSRCLPARLPRHLRPADHGSQWRYGARLVCIDPRRTETADKCHEHIALRPGTDAALALTLMHELIVHGWLDHDYIAHHTLGWEVLRERALQWPPARAAEVCGVPVEQIERLARDHGTRPFA